MAAALGSGFTWDQWKELERQAMIYKYMVASLPVPPHLLLPLLTPNNNLSPDISPNSRSPFGGGSSSSSSIFNLRFSKDKDPEPGRCKRTDGKKWRCSRDVAPHQKYCERHMNRGRPRSRKPVEVQNQQPPSSSSLNNKRTRPLHKHTTPLPPTVPNPTTSPNQPPSFLLSKTIPHLSTAAAYDQPTRGLDWMIERDMLTMDPSEQQWQHLIQSSTGMTTMGSNFYNTSSSIFQPSYREEPLNLLSYTDFGNSNDVQHNGECNLFMNPNLESLVTPRSFIDAWSNDKPYGDNESSVSSHGNLSPSSLNLSMAMAVRNTLDLDDEMGMAGHPKPSQVSSWSSPVSWVPSTAGGPLGEVLLHSTVAVGSNPASPYYAGSPPATVVSSPSGVLHRNVLSLSDSSVCNSPTLAPSTTATPETVFFQWVG